jgi:hypothetical protein
LDPRPWRLRLAATHGLSSEPDADSHRDRNCDSNGDGRAYCYRDSNGDRRAYCYRDSYGDTYRFSHFDCQGDRLANCYRNGNSNSNSNSNGDRDRDGHAHRDSSGADRQLVDAPARGYRG